MEQPLQSSVLHN